MVASLGLVSLLQKGMKDIEIAAFAPEVHSNLNAELLLALDAEILVSAVQVGAAVALLVLVAFAVQ